MHKNIDEQTIGLSNGISIQLAEALKDGRQSLTDEDKTKIILNATEAYGKFLDALGVDWKNDPNASGTPKRVAKAYVLDLWKGRYDSMCDNDITAFPSSYDGIVIEKDIPVFSQCSHHHQSIIGVAHIGYIPSKENAKVLGLSKLNRLVEHYARRGQIQEDLTIQIHNKLFNIIENNMGIAVILQASHNCVSCRGVKHQGASMITSKLSGVFLEKPEVRQELFNIIYK